MNVRVAFARAVYKGLLALYPSEFREQLGESMAQTFRDVVQERVQERRGVSGLVLGTVMETVPQIAAEHWILIQQGARMNTMMPKSNATGVIGLVLGLPFAVLLTLLVLNIEPNFGPLQQYLTQPNPDTPNVVGSLFVLACFVLAIVAVILNVMPLVRAVRAGARVTAVPFNFAVFVLMLGFVLFAVSAVVVDQYPCWVGVPNCD